MIDAQQNRKRCREYYQFNRTKINARTKQGINKLRQEVIKLYGGCYRCGFSDSRALNVEIVNCERKIYPHKDARFRMAKREFNPNKYFILCQNCKSIERNSED